jgi:hypothetical protein
MNAIARLSKRPFLEITKSMNILGSFSLNYKTCNEVKHTHVTWTKSLGNYYNLYPVSEGKPYDLANSAESTDIKPFQFFTAIAVNVALQIWPTTFTTYIYAMTTNIPRIKMGPDIEHRHALLLANNVLETLHCCRMFLFTITKNDY